MLTLADGWAGLACRPVVRIRWGDASRAQRAGFLTAVGVGAGVRVAYLASKWDQELLLNDSLWYSAQAVVLAVEVSGQLVAANTGSRRWCSPP